MPKSTPIYQLKITLADIKPPIWRRVQVKDGSLSKLHAVIQVVMGWTNSHL
jgi:Plasmid pRiA4b ORF-3-like protein